MRPGLHDAPGPQYQQAVRVEADPEPKRLLARSTAVASHRASACAARCSRQFPGLHGAIRRAASVPVSGCSDAKYSSRRSPRYRHGR